MFQLQKKSVKKMPMSIKRMSFLCCFITGGVGNSPARSFLR